MNKVENFFEKLIELKDNNNLTITTIKDVINKSDFSAEIQVDLIERANRHIDCNNEENFLVVANYADANTALECENCYSVIIDSEIHEMMLEEEEQS